MTPLWSYGIYGGEGSSARMRSGRLHEERCHGDPLLLAAGELCRPRGPDLRPDPIRAASSF